MGSRIQERDVGSRHRFGLRLGRIAAKAMDSEEVTVTLGVRGTGDQGKNWGTQEFMEQAKEESSKAT